MREEWFDVITVALITIACVCGVAGIGIIGGALVFGLTAG